MPRLKKLDLRDLLGLLLTGDLGVPVFSVESGLVILGKDKRVVTFSLRMILSLGVLVLALLDGTAGSFLGSGLLGSRGGSVICTGRSATVKLDKLLLGLGVHSAGAGEGEVGLIAQQLEVDL